jgi:hypothetical protein
LPALLEVCPKKCGYTSSCNDKEREMVAQEPARDITRAELAAEITSHTQRKTDRVKASHHELSGSARAGRRVAIQQLGARSQIDARRYRGVRPDELRAGRSIASRDHIKIKEKVNARLSSLGRRRVRLELPGASRNPRGHQPAICLLSAAAFSPLPHRLGQLTMPTRKPIYSDPDLTRR